MVEPIERTNVYHDTEEDIYVHVDEIWVDEDGEPQLSVSQYMDLPIAAHNSCHHHDEFEGTLSLHPNDIHEREERGELVLE